MGEGSSLKLVLKLYGKECMNMCKGLLLLSINSNSLPSNFISLTNNFSLSLKVGNYIAQNENSLEWDWLCRHNKINSHYVTLKYYKTHRVKFVTLTHQY